MHAIYELNGFDSQDYLGIVRPGRPVLTNGKRPMLRWRKLSIHFTVLTQDEADRKKKAAAMPAQVPKVYRSGVGKYIPHKPVSRYHLLLLPFNSRGCQISKFNNNSKFRFVKYWKQMVPCKSTAKEISFKAYDFVDRLKTKAHVFVTLTYL